MKSHEIRRIAKAIEEYNKDRLTDKTVMALGKYDKKSETFDLVLIETPDKKVTAWTDKNGGEVYYDCELGSLY